jgi:hypothetical protein
MLSHPERSEGYPLFKEGGKVLSSNFIQKKKEGIPHFVRKDGIMCHSELYLRGVSSV